MPIGGMSPNEVRSEINRIEIKKPDNPAKAVMSGVRTGEKSGASGKESPFSRGTKKGK